MTFSRITLLALVLLLLAVGARADTLVITQTHGYQPPANADVVRVLRTGGSIWAPVATVQPTERIQVCVDDPAVAVGSTTTCTTRVPGRTDNWQLKSLAIPPPAQKAGTVTFAWDTPTENTDGSPLTDLAGYVLFIRMQDCDTTAAGCAPSGYGESIALPLVNSFTVANVLFESCGRIQAKNPTDVGALSPEVCKPAVFPRVVPGAVPNFR